MTEVTLKPNDVIVLKSENWPTRKFIIKKSSVEPLWVIQDHNRYCSEDYVPGDTISNCVACGNDHPEKEHEACVENAMGITEMKSEEKEVTPYGTRDEFGGL